MWMTVAALLLSGLCHSCKRTWTGVVKAHLSSGVSANPNRLWCSAARVAGSIGNTTVSRNTGTVSAVAIRNRRRHCASSASTCSVPWYLLAEGGFCHSPWQTNHFAVW
jgi:hypothetical protein